LPTLAPVLHVILTPTPTAWLDVGRGPRNPRVSVDACFLSLFCTVPPGAPIPAIRVLGPDGSTLGTWEACGMEEWKEGTRVQYCEVNPFLPA
jgi:hypothetical protein